MSRTSTILNIYISITSSVIISYRILDSSSEKVELSC